MSHLEKTICLCGRLRSFMFIFFVSLQLLWSLLLKFFVLFVFPLSIFNSIQIQFNSKTLFKDGDPVSLQLIFPGDWSKHVNKYNNYSYIYTKQLHRFIVQTQANTTYTFIQKHIHKHSY